jgi:predicted nuclease of restriction endonuclease-like (RecB) superfamily
MKLQSDTFFESIRQVIILSRQRVYRMANSALLESYWTIGKLIVEDEQKGKTKAEYGKATLKNLAQQLTLEFGKGFDERNLNNMRAFYNGFPIWDALRTELSWTHYRLISRLDTEQKRNYYLQESVHSNWNSRELQRQINSMAFERVVKHLPEQQIPAIQNLMKDPYIFEFLGLENNTNNSEKNIETALINHLQKFMLELGKGFAFVARQQHISTDTSDFFIDLVFYNYILKCFVIIDLKTGSLTHQDVGQIDMYVRMYDDLKKTEFDNPTIGILLCTEKDETIVKYSVLNDKNNLFASKYLLYLPKEDELKHLIEQDRLNFELDNE